MNEKFDALENGSNWVNLDWAAVTMNLCYFQMCATVCLFVIDIFTQNVVACVCIFNMHSNAKHYFISNDIFFSIRTIDFPNWSNEFRFVDCLNQIAFILFQKKKMPKMFEFVKIHLFWCSSHLSEFKTIKTKTYHEFIIRSRFLIIRQKWRTIEEIVSASARSRLLFLSLSVILFLFESVQFDCIGARLLHTKFDRFQIRISSEKHAYVVVCMRRNHWNPLNWNYIENIQPQFSLMIFTRKYRHTRSHAHMATHVNIRAHMNLNFESMNIPKIVWVLLVCVILFLLFSLLDTLFISYYLIAFVYINRIIS